MGPRLSAGKNVSAPTIRITPASNTENSVVLTGNVPGEGGTLFFIARFPAIANMGIIIRKRPANIVKPRLMLYQWVLALIPPNAEPLFPALDVKAYRISLNPCGPLLF